MKSTRAIVLGIAALAVVAAGLYFYSPDATVGTCASIAPTPRIVVFGDSLVEGYGATSKGGFVTLLSERMSLPIANYGRSGDTTTQAKARLNAVVAAKPDIALVLLGGNDALRRIPETETEENFRTIITELQKSGSRVILLGVLGGFPRDPYAPMFERLVGDYDITYIPNVLSGVIGRSNLMHDGVHPNQDGYQKIADRILPILEKECQELR